MKQFWTLLVALACALIGKGIGRYAAKTHLTDDTSSILTVAAHRSALRKVGRVAIGIFIAWLGMLALSAFITGWIATVGTIPLITLNCCLAFLAGTAASLAALLYRPYRWDAIQLLIEQKERLIEFLKRFIPVVFVLVVQASVLSLAGDSCAFVTDPTPSVSSIDSTAAEDFLTRTVLDATESVGCRRVVTIAVGCDVRHATRKWIDVPRQVPAVDCSTVEPEPLKGHARFWDHVVGVKASRKAERVSECQVREAARDQEDAEAQRAFTRAFGSALRESERQGCSRIAELVKYLVRSGLHSLIVVVTDAIDNPRSDLDDLVVPPGVHVVIILCRPNPAYAAVDVGLTRAAEWARVPGVTVITAAELRSDLWRSLSEEWTASRPPGAGGR